MIYPAVVDLTVQRHAPFPSVDPFRLVEELTGAPINVTGATFKLEVRLSDSAPDVLIEETMATGSGSSGLYGPPAFTEAAHEGLPESNPQDPRPLTGASRFRYAIKATGIPNEPSPLIVQRGYYIVEDGAAF